MGRTIVTQLPDPGQEQEMRIPSNTEIQQVAHRLVSTACRDHSLQCETPQHLRDLKVKEVRRMQGFISRIDSPLNALPRRCLKKPINCG